MTCGDSEKKIEIFVVACVVQANTRHLKSASLIGRERLRNVQKINERAKRASYCFSMLNMQICVTVLVVVASLPIVC